MKSDSQIIQGKRIDKMLVLYESQPWMRAIVQAVPWAGGSVDTLLAWRAIYLNKQRVEELFSNISERLSNIEESTLNEDFLQSEEFFELLRSCIDVVSRTASEYKRNYVADFLAGTIKRSEIHDLSLQIAEDLRVLQDLHLHILSLLPEKAGTIINFHEVREKAAMDWSIFNKGTSDLERLGFIRLDSDDSLFNGGGHFMVHRVAQYTVIFKKSTTA